MQTISDYISQVRLQQAINPLFPKQDDNLSDFYLPYTQAESIQYLINKPFNYLSTNTLKVYTTGSLLTQTTLLILLT
jgi:hypothetical protein